MRKLVVIPAPAVMDSLRRTGGQGVMDIIADTYLLHADGKVINPDSYFLRFPDSDKNRIIALPAAIRDGNAISGIKWVSSYPDNLRDGLPRASAVLILNDALSGYPIACLEGSHISAIRTAASAALAARHLNDDPNGIVRVGIIGAGVIAAETLRMLRTTFPGLDEIRVHDLNETRAQAFCQSARQSSGVARANAAGLDEVFDSALVVLATTASSPYLDRDDLVRPGSIILNISLRDLTPEIILRSWNLFDDVDHCLKAQTSPHLALQLSGTRDFIAGTLADLMRGEIIPDRTKPMIFSPFGLGVLDLAIGRVVLEDAVACGKAIEVSDFFTGSA